MKFLQKTKVKIIVIITLVILAVIVSIILINNKPKQKIETKENKTETKYTKSEEVKATELKLKEIKVNLNSNLNNIEWSEYIENINDLTESDKTKFVYLKTDEIDFTKAGTYNYYVKYDNKIYTGKCIVLEQKIEETITSFTENKTTEETSSSATKQKNVSEPTTSSSNTESVAPAQPTETLHIPVGTYSSKGATLTSDGNGNLTLTYMGASAPVKEKCVVEGHESVKVCSIYAISGTSSNIAFINSSGSVTENQLGNLIIDKNDSFNFYYSNSESLNTFNSINKLNVISPSLTGTGIDFENRVLQIKFELNRQGINGGIYYTYGTDFKINGAIILKATPNGKGIAGTEESFDLEQLFY